jgi:molecular chaperone Hsp33
MPLVVHEGEDNIALPFAVEALDIRGRVVRLADVLNGILNRHAYPPLVARVLGEAITMSVLLGSVLKNAGRFQLQTKTEGVINLIVVDYEHPDEGDQTRKEAKIRAYARYDGEALASLMRASTPDLLGKGYLAMTLEENGAASRYQGVVPLDGQSFEEAAHHYFMQSEQIPMCVRIAVAETYETTDEGRVLHQFRGGGVMVQFLPTSPDRQRQMDLSHGDVPEGVVLEDESFHDDEAWAEAKALMGTIEDHELVDPTLGSERLLYRLFHERGVSVFPALPVQEACRCSRERIVQMLANFSDDDRAQMKDEHNRVTITCEFCSTAYVMSEDEIVGGVSIGDVHVE